MIRRLISLAAAGLVLVFFAPTLWAAPYQIDHDHSAVSFKVRHLFAHVQGSFNEFEGTFDYEPGKPETWKAQADKQDEYSKKDSDFSFSGNHRFWSI